MCFRIVRRGTNGLASFDYGALAIAFLHQSVRQINVRFREYGNSAKSYMKLGDGVVELALREENPSQGVVGLGTFGIESDSLFEGRTRALQVAALYCAHTLRIGGNGLCGGIFFSGWRGLGSKGTERNQRREDKHFKNFSHKIRAHAGTKIAPPC